jgi:hypothetical protein
LTAWRLGQTMLTRNTVPPMRTLKDRRGGEPFLCAAKPHSAHPSWQARLSGSP